jgi:CubicO group peptidase (beta-lactamase class C family)
MKSSIYALTLACVTLANQAAAQTVSQKLDGLFQTSPINGNVLVAENGRIIYQKSFGYADLAAKTPITNDSPFQTASVAKSFTSTAVLQLRDKRKLNLDDPFVKYFPEFPFPAIAIKHLLSHTSGLPNLELYERLVRDNPELIIMNKDAIPALRLWNKPLKFQPGEKWNYCNTNYVLLALLVEKLSNQPFETYLEKNVFAPARMNHTYVQTNSSPVAGSRAVTRHMLPTMYKTVPENVKDVRLKDRVKMWRIKYETYNLGATLGDQNVISTTEDLFRFDEALSSGKLLSQASMDEAFAPTKLNNGQIYYEDFGPQYGRCSYGFGWIVCDSQDVGKTVSHDGFNRGIATQFYRNLTKKQTIVMFDNTEGPGFNQKVAAVIDILNSKPSEPPLIKQSIARHFGEALLEKGFEAALIKFNEVRGDAGFYLDEREMNILGYDLLFNDYKSQAVEAFRMNVLMFPNSFNVYDSYAEALAENGKREEAILMYRKAIALNPKSEGSLQALKRLEAK